MRSVASLVLSAGLSQRMGTHKALLRIGSTSFLRHIVETHKKAGLNTIRVVLGADADTIRCAESWVEEYLVINNNWAAGQLSSVVAGLHSIAARSCRGLLLHAVDHPLVTVGTIESLLGAFEASGATVVIPTFKGERGHPIVIDSAIFAELESVDSARTMRDILKNHIASSSHLPVDDAGVIRNINTPADYQRFLRNAQGAE